MAGFFNALMRPLQDHLDQTHKQEEARRANQRVDLWRVIQDNNTSDEGRDAAWADLQKLSHPEAKIGIKKIQELFGKIKPPQQAAQASATQQTEVGPPDVNAPVARGPIQPPPQAGGRQSPFMTAVQIAQRHRDAVTSEYNFWLEKGKQVLGPDADKRDLAEYAGSKGTKLPARAVPGTRQDRKFKLADNSEVDVQYDPKTGVHYDLQNDPWDVPEGASRIATKTSAARPTIIASDVVTLKDAKSLKDAGMPFLSADGKAIELDKVPPGMILQKIHYADGRTVYEPRNIADKVVTVGNVRYAVNPMEVQGLADGQGTALGVANPGSTGTRAQITLDADGNPMIGNLPSSRTPTTTGVQGRPAAAPGPGVATPPAQRPAAVPPAQSGGPAPRGAANVGIPAGVFNRALDRVTPVREAATQLFGDPSQPDLKGLNSFVHLADNKQSRERLGKALKLTFDGLTESSGGGHISAGAGPVSVNAGGGLIDLMSNYFGIPPALAASQAKIMQDAISGLSAEEKEAYNATMSAFGTIVGLRSLTKASAAQASVKTIEREMPVIGVNTVSAAQFHDQMARLAEIIYNGSKGIPSGMWDPKMLERIKGLPAEAARARNAQSGGPSPRGRIEPPSDVPADVQKALKGQSPGVHTLSDGSKWMVGSGGNITKQ